MGSGFDERCGSCAPYSRAYQFLKTCIYYSRVRVNQGHEVIEKIGYTRLKGMTAAIPVGLNSSTDF